MTGGSGPIRLLLADDHPVVRAGLRAVLAAEPDFEIAAEAPTAERAVELAAAGGIDVVLMDLQFGPGGAHGAEATAQITARTGAPRVLVLTTYDTDADILAAVEAGAAGYSAEGRPAAGAGGGGAHRRLGGARRWPRRWPHRADGPHAHLRPPRSAAVSWRCWSWSATGCPTWRSASACS
ncbi:DNA-binding response regulator [Streptomyces sp. e14]|nr:DNA-binding response regulator [Streptomyces sp. e14]